MIGSMKKGAFQLFQFYPSRVPRLFFGPSAQRRPLSPREQRAEQLFVVLQFISNLLFMIGAAFGYYSYRIYGLLAFLIFGYVAGVWMRRSLGMRNVKPTTGFFARMRERAMGARPGLLEGLLEMISGHTLSARQAREIVQVYDQAVRQLKTAKSPRAQNEILASLDLKVNQLYYNS